VIFRNPSYVSPESLRAKPAHPRLLQKLIPNTLSLHNIRAKIRHGACSHDINRVEYLEETRRHDCQRSRSIFANYPVDLLAGFKEHEDCIV
jgi:hypothetical protein